MLHRQHHGMRVLGQSAGRAFTSRVHDLGGQDSTGKVVAHDHVVGQQARPTGIEPATFGLLTPAARPSVLQALVPLRAPLDGGLTVKPSRPPV